MGLAFSGFVISFLLVIIKAWLKLHETFLLVSLAGGYIFYVIIIHIVKNSVKKSIKLLNTKK